MTEPLKKPIIVFDLGGVLVDWNPRYLYRRLFNNDEAAMEQFLAEVCTSAWNEEQDAGRSFETAIQVLIEKYPQQENLIRAWFERWDEMLGGEIAGTVEILKDLKRQNYRLYALSNWSAETWSHALRRFEFLKLFGEIFVSGFYHLKKPDPRFFAILLQKIEQPAVDCIFIDDSTVNVNAAREMGFQAVHFESSEQLAAELSNLNVQIFE